MSPRDRFITVYGKMPVREVLEDGDRVIDKILVARDSRGQAIAEIKRLAADLGVLVLDADPERIKLLSGNGRQDQGVMADVLAPGMASLESWLAGGNRGSLLLLDRVNNPANVGMILRTATAAGMAGVILPHRHSPEVGPLVIKASAGVAFKASILRSSTPERAAELLVDHGYRLCGLDGRASESLWSETFHPDTAFVLGNESDGLSSGVANLLTSSISLPMNHGVESINVASAAAVLCFELARRARPDGEEPG